MGFYKFGATCITFLILAGHSASAADLFEGGQPAYNGPILATGINWNGFYLGGNYGYGLGNASWANPTGIYANPAGDIAAASEADGQVIGVTLGYNIENGPMVFGLESNFEIGKMSGNANCGGMQAGFSGDTCQIQSNFLGSLTSRMGYATGNSLFYVKGGLAYAQDQFRVANGVLNPTLASNSLRKSHIGWTWGAGLEYAIDPHWSASAEYDYFAFGNQSVNFVSLANPASIGAYRVNHSQELIKFGLNYRFGGNGEGTPDPDFMAMQGVTVTFGTRVGYSSGRFQKKLYDPNATSQLNSRLTWKNQAGGALETFATLDTDFGFFTRGFVGGIDLGKATMNDEDFPPGIAPYSNTASTTNNGRDVYGTLDAGYTLVKASNYQIGALLGYNLYSQRINGFGCNQLASNPAICFAGQIPTSTLGLSETETRSSIRLGLSGDMMLTDRLNFFAEAAWLPYSVLTGKDNHWLRPDINSLAEIGHGARGYQLESHLTYAATDHLSIGIGARYWSFASAGSVLFPGQLATSSLTTTSNRLTTFLQAGYSFK